jgi:hypothetical protein
MKILAKREMMKSLWILGDRRHDDSEADATYTACVTGVQLTFKLRSSNSGV